MRFIIVRQRFVRNELPSTYNVPSHLFESREAALQVASLVAAEEKGNLEKLKEPLVFVDDFYTPFDFDFSIGQKCENITRIVSGFKVWALDM